jgi:acyl-coenzyme A thioesterase PaaI-like protein
MSNMGRGPVAGAVAGRPATGCAEHAAARSRSLQAVSEAASEPPAPGAPGRGHPGAEGADDGRAAGGGPRSLDGVSSFMGLRWEDPQTVRLTIRPELINGGGLLSGVATYAMVDYCMGSTLWVQTTREERIATISIAINYVQTATEGEIVCRTTLDRRNRRTAVMRSEVHHEDGRLLVTAIGSYTIFPRRTPPTTPSES